MNKQFFSIIGTNFLQVWQGPETKVPADFGCDVEMTGDRPSATAVAQADGTWLDV